MDIAIGKIIYPIKTIKILLNKLIFSYLYPLNKVKKRPVIRVIPNVRI